MKNITSVAKKLVWVVLLIDVELLLVVDVNVREVVVVWVMVVKISGAQSAKPPGSKLPVARSRHLSTHVTSIIGWEILQKKQMQEAKAMRRVAQQYCIGKETGENISAMYENM